jgi:flagellar biosynthesis/type III secretory pathway protein FliH
MAVSKLPAPIWMLLAVVAVFALNGFSNAQSHDWHLLSRDLFVKSTFAHGYIHGYEEGFHNGDLDMQMGRNFRDVKCHEKFKKPTGFKDGFGPKGIYEDGYRKGYLVGYVDSFEGRNFRAIALLRESVEPGPNRSVSQVDREYDSAFRQGYDAGQTKGLQDGRSTVIEAAGSVSCQESLARGGTGEPRTDYCEAYRNGYQLGYSDGFANQRERAKVLAKK